MEPPRAFPGGGEPDAEDFFLSYSSGDRRWAEWVAWSLEEAGYSTVLQAWDFRPGSNFVLEMQRAAARAKRTLALLSPDYLLSVYAQPEWSAAFAEDPTGERGKLVPVRVRTCELRGLFKAMIFIDLVGFNEEEARAALLHGIERGRAKPESPPVFPGQGARRGRRMPRFPGDWPVLWNVPHLRNQNFVGREDILVQLRTALGEGDEEKPRVQALHGLGGVGKTQVALEYAYRYSKENYVVWWLRAEEPATLVTDYATLGEALELPEPFLEDWKPKGEALNRRIEAVRTWLERNQDWLLIFDDVDALRAIKDYLPRRSKGHILLTSRNPSWLAVATPRPVAPLDRSSSVDFLLKRTAQASDLDARALAEELGDLPLALEQAGAYMEETGLSLSAYLALFRTRRRELLDRGAPSTSYPATVATTWLISFQHLETAMPAAGDLLRLSAFFAPDNIPLSLFSEGAPHLPPSLAAAAADPLILIDTRAALRRYSLAGLTDEAMSIHRLVQAVVIERMEPEERGRWAEAAAQVVHAAFTRRSDRPDLQVALLPHALAAASHAEREGVARETTADLLDRIGLFLSGEGYLREARVAFERSLAVYEAFLGSEHSQIATVLNNLGTVARGLEELDVARACHRRALEIDRAHHPADHPDVAIDLYNLGLTLFDLGEETEAAGLFSQAIDMLTRTLGDSHPDTLLIEKNVWSLLGGSDE